MRSPMRPCRKRSRRRACCRHRGPPRSSPRCSNPSRPASAQWRKRRSCRWTDTVCSHNDGLTSNRAAVRVWRTVSKFVFAAASLVWSAAHAALPAGLDDASIRAAAADSFPAFFELLALPNDAVNASDIQKNAAWLQRAFEQRGFRVRQLENKGRPLVFAEYRQEDADARTASADPPRGTVLFY